MKDYALYTIFDDNYVEMGMNMIYSFLYNNSWFNGDIIILCDSGKYCNINEENRKQISKLYKNIIFEDSCYEKYQDIVNHALEYSFSPYVLKCYYKAELLRKDLYKLKVYIDADIIVNDNIQELFTNDFNNAATIDIGVYMSETQKSNPNLPQLNLKIDKMYKKYTNEYFNAGVLLLNNNYIDDNLYEKFINFSKSFSKESFKHPLSQKGELVDQDVFNEILDNVIIIPFIYQFTSYTLEYINNAKIIHYCGKHFKPTIIVNKDDPRLLAFNIYYRYNYLREHKNNI